MKWIKLFALLLVFIAIARADANSISSWDKMQISPNMLCDMPYGNLSVQIYQHLDNFKSTTSHKEKKYFYKPIALLEHRSAVSTFNDLTKEWQLRFIIHMWNEIIASQVSQYLSTVVGQEVEPNQVEVIYLEKVILTSSKPSSMYSLPSNWLLFQSQTMVRFYVSCLQQSHCDQLADDMRTHPEQFDHLQLRFSLDLLESQTRETAIRIGNVVKGKMVNSLLQRFYNKDEILLTANDEKTLLAESTKIVIVETFVDSWDIVSPELEEQVSKKLKDFLFSSSRSIQEQSDKRWESIFWNDDDNRPDKVSKKMNYIYQKLDKDEQSELISAYQKINEAIAGSTAGDNNFLLSLFNVNADFASQGVTSLNDVDKFLLESIANVEWDGEKFTPKALSLSRINLSQLRDTRSFKDKTVRVRHSAVVLSTPIYYDRAEGKDEERLFNLINRTSSSVNEIEALVMKGVNINCRNNRGMTPLLLLMEVSNENTIDIFRILMKNKVDIKAKDNEGRTALHVLCQNYKNDNIFDVARLLIDSGVDVKAKDIYGETALLLLCQYSQNENLIATVQLLIDWGVDVNAQTNSGWNALHSLCQVYKYDNLNEIVQLLIENKVDINAKIYDGSTALHLLCENYKNDNLNEIVQLLIKNKIDVKAKADDGWTALHVLSAHNQNDNMKETVQLLIENKVDVNAKTKEGWTALHFLSSYNQNDNLKEIIQLLIESKIEVNAKTINEGSTALHLLSQTNQEDNLKEIFQLLIESKVDINAKNNDGSTALQILSRYNQEDNLKEIFQLLIDNEVDINAKNNDGWTALLLLCRHYQNDNLEEIVELLIGHKVDLDANFQGFTALTLLCRYYKYNNLNEIVQLLIENQIDVHAKTDDGSTALHYLSCLYKNENIIDIIPLFVQQQVDVRAENSYGISALKCILNEYDKRNKDDVLKILYGK